MCVFSFILKMGHTLNPKPRSSWSLKKAGMGDGIRCEEEGGLGMQW